MKTDISTPQAGLNIKKFIDAVFPYYRSICSPGLDQALEVIREELIPELVVEKYPTGSEAWTWFLPQKWDLKRGSIRLKGKTLISTKEEPLCVWSGSLPVKKTVTYEELMAHTYTDKTEPGLIRWYFRYYGNLDWGFNLPYSLVEKLDPEGVYEVEIDARYYDDDFQVGNVLIPGRSEKIILITSDICHPFQCNDSLSGAGINYALYEYFKDRDNFYTYLFSFVPETIGTIAFLSHHEEWLPRIVYSLYSEFWGREGLLHYQKSLKGDTQLDRIIQDYLKDHYLEGNYKTLPFRRGGVKNDEMVTACPGMHIPSIAFNRIAQPSGYFREYHSNWDTPERLRYEEIEEGFRILKDVLTTLDERGEEPPPGEKLFKCVERLANPAPPTDFIPEPLFKGTLFLTRYGLWVDWRKDPKLNGALDEITACLNGLNSVAEIAQFVDLPYETVYSYLLKFEERGLISRKPKGSHK